MFIKNVFELKKDVEELNNYVYLPSIDMSNHQVGKMLDSVAQYNVRIQDTLNLINNQGIHNLDIVRRSYQIKDKQLYFSDLASSERLFLVAEAADISKTATIFIGEVGELTDKTLTKFFVRFSRSEYVNIVGLDEVITNYYKFIRKESINA